MHPKKISSNIPWYPPVSDRFCRHYSSNAIVLTDQVNQNAQLQSETPYYKLTLFFYFSTSHLTPLRTTVYAHMFANLSSTSNSHLALNLSVFWGLLFITPSFSHLLFFLLPYIFCVRRVQSCSETDCSAHPHKGRARWGRYVPGRIPNPFRKGKEPQPASSHRFPRLVPALKKTNQDTIQRKRWGAAEKR